MKLRIRMCLYAIVVGTRPEIIKMAPVIKLLGRGSYILVHTGQHYSYELDRVFFEGLGLPEPDYRLDVGLRASTHGEQTGLMLIEVERILLAEKPGFVVVQGDTNTTLAGALAAKKLNTILVTHVEAGLRSGNWENPFGEDVSRKIIRILQHIEQQICRR